MMYCSLYPVKLGRRNLVLDYLLYLHLSTDMNFKDRPGSIEFRGRAADAFC